MHQDVFLESQIGSAHHVQTGHHTASAVKSIDSTHQCHTVNHSPFVTATLKITCLSKSPSLFEPDQLYCTQVTNQL